MKKLNLIDKLNQNFTLRGEEETQKVVDSFWVDQDQENTYVNFTYSKSIMKDIPDILLEQQYDKDVGASVCCYCMRRIRKKNDTKEQSKDGYNLEHIIPEKISDSTKLSYFDSIDYFKQILEDTNNPIPNGKVRVYYKGKLKDNEKSQKIIGPPHPHFVSYYNLVASCNGNALDKKTEAKPSQCCNNYRKQNEVYPYYIDQKAIDGIEFRKQGNIIFTDPIKEEHLNEKGININTNFLRLVRAFWSRIARSNYLPSDIDEADITKRKQILKKLKDDDPDNSLAEKWDTLEKEEIWKIVADYCWFYYYYKNKQTN